MISLAVLYLVFMLFLAHFLAPKDYSWVRKTVSSLAGQKYERRIVLQAGFVGFGLIFWASLFTGHPFRDGGIAAIVAFFTFSTCMVLVGIFRTRPMEEVEYSRVEARLHNALSLIAGFSFFAGVLAFAISEPGAAETAIHSAAAALFVPLALGFFLLRPVKGLFLRGLYLVGFAWLLAVDNRLL